MQMTFEEAAECLRDALSPIDVAGAYAVQTINTRFWEAQGRRIVGRKAGLTTMHENIPGSQLEIFNECGHWPQHEHADRFNELSIRFLKSAQ